MHSVCHGQIYIFMDFLHLVKKKKQEHCSGIMVMPWWKTKVWSPMMVKLLINFTVLLRPNLLTLLWNKSMQQPLYPKMKLLAIQLSGRHSKTQPFLQELLTLPQIRGEQKPKGEMNRYSDDGSHMLHQGIRIPILQM